MAALQCWSCIQFNKFHVNDNGIDGDWRRKRRKKNKIYLYGILRRDWKLKKKIWRNYSKDYCFKIYNRQMIFKFIRFSQKWKLTA